MNHALVTPLGAQPRGFHGKISARATWLSAPGPRASGRHARGLLPCAVQSSDPSDAPGSATQTTTSDSPSSKEAVLARIAAAKAYKEGLGGQPPAGPSPPAPPSREAPASPPAASPPTSSTRSSSSSNPSGKDVANTPPWAPPSQPGFLDGPPPLMPPLSITNPSSSSSSSGGGSTGGPRPPPRRPDFLTSVDAPETMELLKGAPTRSGYGSADQAADWLQGVLSAEGPGIDPNLRPEAFTAAKEYQQKQRGAEIISVDAYQQDQQQQQEPASTSEGRVGEAGGSGSGAAYQPKVTTWGVFPRPTNISAAYGGGRNIRPGQALETTEQKAKREAEYAAALQRYKKAAGTDAVSDEAMAAAKRSYEAAMSHFKRGQLREALEGFNQARDMVPLKTQLGGMATLQAAVCYDTLGAAKEAEALYRRIRGHPTREVSRKAKQLVFGFQAMDFLKTRSISYAVDKKAYDPYFRRFADASRLYIASEEERAADAAAAQRAALLALSLILGPLLMVAGLVGGRGL